jgi:23S rRNA pseudouridine1911/1915/1917 synthase
MDSILYEDNHIIVASKLNGQLTDNDESNDLSLLESLRSYVKIKYQKPGEVYLTPIHRLDRGVSGVVLFAKTSKAADRLNAQFRDRVVQKKYLSFVTGEPPSEGHLEDFLARDRKRRMTLVTGKSDPEGKKSILDFKLKKVNTKGSLLEVFPLTGRPHQIRVQLSSRGWPIVGDVKYGSKISLDGGILLHAVQLNFKHPVAAKEMEFSVPVPKLWSDWIQWSEIN